MERPGGRLLLHDARRSADPGVLEALLGLARGLLQATTPTEVASTLLDVVVSTYGFPRGVVLGHVENLLSPLASHAPTGSATGVGSSRVADRAQAERATQVVAHLDAAEEPLLTQVCPAGSTVLVLPLLADQRALGAVVLQVPTVLLGRRGRRMLAEVEAAVENGGVALQRVQQLRQLQRLAATDDLTRIANRRSFLDSLDRELARSMRRSEPLSLVIMDLDHFKQVNDLHGHQAGDDALRNVAAALAVACRDLDTPARYGGEEFVVILPDCDIDQCLPIAERLRAAVGSAPAVMRLTASAGVATFPHHARDGEELIASADRALLRAKERGRNQTVVAHSEPQPQGRVVLPPTSRIRRSVPTSDPPSDGTAPDGVGPTPAS